MNIILWCNQNQGFLSMILSIVTICVSLYVMYRSNKNNKIISERTNQIEKNIALRQETLQTYQLKIDIFQYKIEVLRCLEDLRNKMESLKDLFELIPTLKNNSFDNLYQRYQNNPLDKNIIIEKINQGKLLFPKELSPLFNDTVKYFSNINNAFLRFKFLSESLTQDEQNKLQQKKEDDIKIIYNSSKDILYDLNKLIKYIYKNTDISDIFKLEE